MGNTRLGSSTADPLGARFFALQKLFQRDLVPFAAYLRRLDLADLANSAELREQFLDTYAEMDNILFTPEPTEGTNSSTNQIL